MNYLRLSNHVNQTDRQVMAVAQNLFAAIVQRKQPFLRYIKFTGKTQSKPNSWNLIEIMTEKTNCKKKQFKFFCLQKISNERNSSVKEDELDYDFIAGLFGGGLFIWLKSKDWVEFSS